MIKKLKHKMIITIMFFVTIIILAFMLVINLIPYQSSYREAISFLNQSVMPTDLGHIKPSADIMPGSDTAPSTNLLPGSAPPSDFTPDFSDEPEPPRDDIENPNENMMSHSNLIYCYLDADGNLMNWTSNRENLYNGDNIQKLISAIYGNGKSEGAISGYYYVYRPFENESMMILLDNRVAFHNFQTVLIITLFAGPLVWVLLLILSIFIVNRMTYPITATFEKQKQFISDAGHELKTPVAVISANAEVLSKEIGDNKWLSYIQTETRRMDKLIKNLMILAQIDDSDKKYVHSVFNLSQTILGASLPFESLAFENGTLMEFDITSDLFICGNKELLEQLVIILLSNALKYGKEKGLIRVSLHKQHKAIILSVYNTGVGIRPEDIDKIFERFYRVEKERSRKDGNYGLGLAIAKSIVMEHNGKISVQSEYGKDVTFTVELNEFSKKNHA